MMRQLPVVYGEWLVKDHSWDFVVDYVKGARMFFLTGGSTHEELVQMAQEDYNLDMNTKVVELTYSLPEAMMQQMAPTSFPPIHVTSDRQVRNLIEITKTHYVHLCVSSRGKFENKETEDSNEAEFEVEVEPEAKDSNEREEYEAGKEYDDNLPEDGEDDREKDVDISYFDEDVDDAKDYSVYGIVKDEEEVEEDDMSFEELKAAYDREGCTGVARGLFSLPLSPPSSPPWSVGDVSQFMASLRLGQHYEPSLHWGTSLLSQHQSHPGGEVPKRRLLPLLIQRGRYWFRQPDETTSF
ncbi:hypothetical protein N665_0339s0046 [Sinapis alba]|nr:hypothetical protein N665_0339s0046 [Sinapis alba]